MWVGGRELAPKIDHGIESSLSDDEPPLQKGAAAPGSRRYGHARSARQALFTYLARGARPAWHPVKWEWGTPFVLSCCLPRRGAMDLTMSVAPSRKVCAGNAFRLGPMAVRSGIRARTWR